MEFSVWVTYLVATIILSVSPGPGVFSSLAAGLNHGFRRGMWNAVGMQVANLALMVFVSIGLGAILLASVLGRWIAISLARTGVLDGLRIQDDRRAATA